MRHNRGQSAPKPQQNKRKRRPEHKAKKHTRSASPPKRSVFSDF
jgi:hypothetical protein